MAELKQVQAGNRLSAAVENAQTEELRRLRAIVDRIEGESGGIVRLGYIATRTRELPAPGSEVGYTVGFWGRPDRAHVTVPPERVARAWDNSIGAPLTPFEVGQLVKLKVWPPMVGVNGGHEVVFIDESEKYLAEMCQPQG